MNTEDLRTDYASGALRRCELDPNPIRQFELWFAEAAAHSAIPEPNAMTLATAGQDGRVGIRVVLLKGWDSDGFRFFTNYGSHKAAQIGENPNVALCFHWAALERQVRISGTAEKTSREISEAYFQRRPRSSQLGAWASKQSLAVASREVIERQFEEAEARFAGGPIPIPPFWGGFCVKPAEIEFWQGRPSRLHDRFLYSRREDGGWNLDRISP